MRLNDEAAPQAKAEPPRKRQRKVAAISVSALFAATFLAAYPAAIDRWFVVQSAVLATMLVSLSVIDLKCYRLPDSLTLPLIAIGCLVVLPLTIGQVGWRIFSAAAAFLTLYAVAEAYSRWRGHAGLGLGDAKLLAAAGAWLGLEAIPDVILIASSSALVTVAAAAVAGHRIDTKTRVPFGPFLAFAIWTIWLIGSLF
jgi:leader peptidase (prepilin peptidase) / N-methyltransferase